VCCRDTAHFDRFQMLTFAVILAINACGRAKGRGDRHSWLRWGWHGQFPLLRRWRGSTGVLRYQCIRLTVSRLDRGGVGVPAS